MISVSFKRDKQNNPIGFKCIGHAGFASYGKDIVCAAVSILAFTAVNSIDELTEDPFIFDQNEKKGMYYLEFRDTPSESAILLLKSFEIGIRSITEVYSHKYIKIVDWEV